MVRIDCLIFGYRRLKINPEDLSEFTSLMIRASIFSSINNSGEIIVRERELVKIIGILKGRIEFVCSEPLGLYGRWIRFEHKRSAVAAMIISALILVLLSGIVWDIRISGNEELGDEEIIEMLDNSGFGIGNFWGLVNRVEIESDMLCEENKIAWININRRGTVAYVRVIESKSDEQEDTDAKGYGNIVASCDCVIEEVTVKRGIPVVKPGDVVKKGDLLVVGALPAELGGGLCYADATVIGRVYDEISVGIERNYEKKLFVDRKLAKITLNFFDFSINIFKIYGNLTNDCDIIEDEIEYSHLDRVKFPFSITVSYIPIFKAEEASYTDSEMLKLASDRLNQQTNDRLSGADLLKIRTDGELTDKGYVIRSELVLLCEVGTHSILEIN